MKKIALAVASASLLLTGAASAADMPVKARPAPPPVAAVYNWTGFYIGGHCGGAWGRTTSSSSPVGGVNGGFDTLFNTSYSEDTSGWLCGGQIGYNWQASNWVFGLEGDLGYIGIDKSSTRNSPDGDTDFVSVRYNDWYGTVTGRIGYAWNNSLLYVKGGAAFAGIRNQAADEVVAGVIDLSDFVETTETRVGYAVGAGWEYGFTPNWSLKLEYLFMDFGRTTVSHFDPGFGVTDTFQFKNQLHTAKIGLNYRFGGPVVAKY